MATPSIGSHPINQLQTPPSPYSKQRKVNPDKDSMTDQERRFEGEKEHIWKPTLAIAIKYFLKLWVWSAKKSHLTQSNLDNMPVPDFLPESTQAPLTEALSEKIATVLEYPSSMQSLSTLSIPDLPANPEAEKYVIDALVEKIQFLGQNQSYTLGKSNTEISKLFISAFIEAQPSHQELTLESLPEIEGDFTRLIESLKTTRTLTLSTTIEPEISKKCIKALKAMPKLKTIIIRHPAGQQYGMLQKETWDRLEKFLNNPKLKVKLDRVLPPEGKPDWMKKATAKIEEAPKTSDSKVEIKVEEKK